MALPKGHMQNRIKLAKGVGQGIGNPKGGFQMNKKPAWNQTDGGKLPALNPYATKPVTSAPTGGPAAPSDPVTPQKDMSNPAYMDPAYTSQTAANQGQYDTTMAGYTFQENQAKQDFGFEDMSNPFNRALMLQRSYDQRRSGELNGMASRGQLYSSALTRAQDETDFSQDRDTDALRRDYDRIMGGIAQGRLQAGTDLSMGNADALGDATGRALQVRPEGDRTGKVAGAADLGMDVGSVLGGLGKKKKRGRKKGKK